MLSSLSFRYRNQYDTDALIYFRAVEQVSSFDLTSVQPWLTPTYVKYWINNLVIRLKENGSWNSIHSCVLMRCASSLAGALIPLKGTAPTNNNFVAGDYNPITGLKGNAGNKWLNCNVNNNIFPAESLHLSTWVSEPDTQIGLGVNLFGTSGNVGGSNIYIRADDSWQYLSQGSSMVGSSYGFTSARSSPIGLVGHSRVATPSFFIMQAQGDSTTTAPGASQNPLNELMSIFSFQGNDFFNTYASDARLSWYSIGLGLNLNSLRDSITDLNEAMTSDIPIPAGIGGEVGWWCPSLDDDGEGTDTLYDLSGSTNNGTLTDMDATTDWVTDGANGGIRALEFDGVDDRVLIPHASVLMPTTAISISCWVKFNLALASQIDFITLVSKETYVSNNGYFLAFRTDQTDNWLSFRINGSLTVNSINWVPGAFFDDLNWHHVCATYDKINMRLYVDGVERASAAYTTDIASNTNSINLFGKGNWRGDNVRIFNRTLAPIEVSFLYNSRRDYKRIDNNRLDKLFLLKKVVQR